MRLTLFTLFFVLAAAAGLASYVPGFASRLDSFHLFGLRGDYLAHGIVVFSLIMLAGAWLRGHRAKRTVVLCAPLLILAASVSQEILQLFIPWRVYNPYDMLSELTGAVLAMPGYLIVVRKKLKG